MTRRNHGDGGEEGGTATAFWDNGSGDWFVYGHPDGSGIQYTLIKDWAPR